jgi:uncharacterized protein YqgV (UPF0045/DUF77 family)
MKISVEISMYPLETEYGTRILQFVGRLKNYPDLLVKPNTMSTQIFGEYESVMKALTSEMRVAFDSENPAVMVMKFASVDLRP